MIRGAVPVVFAAPRSLSRAGFSWGSWQAVGRGRSAIVLADAGCGDAFPWGPWIAVVGRILFHALAFAAIAFGGAAALHATAREARRRRFVKRVEASEEPGFRVEPTPAGKVLLRVAPAATYRVADREEEIIELDEEGRATRRAG